LLLAIIVAAVLAGYLFLYGRAGTPQPVASNFQKMEIVKLTETGKVGTAAFHPMGAMLLS
jgi:hypothetical protein